MADVEMVYGSDGALIGLRLDGTSYPIAAVVAALRGQVEVLALRQALGEAERQLAAVAEALELPRAGDPAAAIRALRAEAAEARQLPEPVLGLIWAAQRVAALAHAIEFAHALPSDVTASLQAVIVRARADAQRELLGWVGPATFCLPPEEVLDEPPAPSIPRREVA